MRIRYTVIVGNIGTVHDEATGRRLALRWFTDYVEKSKTDSGRCAGEDVTILRDGAIWKEYHGTNAS